MNSGMEHKVLGNILGKLHLYPDKIFSQKQTLKKVEVGEIEQNEKSMIYVFVLRSKQWNNGMQ